MAATPSLIKRRHLSAEHVLPLADARQRGPRSTQASPAAIRFRDDAAPRYIRLAARQDTWQRTTMLRRAIGRFLAPGGRLDDGVA